jgi:hypothetical protein
MTVDVASRDHALLHTEFFNPGDSHCLNISYTSTCRRIQSQDLHSDSGFQSASMEGR